MPRGDLGTPAHAFANASYSLDLQELPAGEFQPSARYYEAMDFLLYLREDVSYRADRVDSFLTLLWHPYEARTVGVKLKGFRFLFKQLQAICRAQGRALSDSDFMPLMSALEVAMTAGLGASLTDGAERKALGKKPANRAVLRQWSLCRGSTRLFSVAYVILSEISWWAIGVGVVLASLLVIYFVLLLAFPS